MPDERQEGGAAAVVNADLACLAKRLRLYSLAVFSKPIAHEFALQGETFTQSEPLYAPRHLVLKTTPARDKQKLPRHNRC
ncbi:hypothetical protein [Pseudomonas tohonis]|uniref:hypothetical protein n=1 Tax=Pseudomonas tohonis TaxID=2725477 RepID=UPI001F1FA6F4|nr:hypothetical protein [Pseudomonas tohonis]